MSAREHAASPEAETAPEAPAAAKLADDVRGVHEDLIVDGQDRDRSLPGEAYHLISPINVSVHHLVVQLQPLKLFLDYPTVRAVSTRV